MAVYGPLLGPGAAGDGEGHGKRQCDDAHDQPSHDVGQPVLAFEQTSISGFQQSDQPVTPE